jgi:hypothetical protein
MKAKSERSRIEIPRRRENVLLDGPVTAFLSLMSASIDDAGRTKGSGQKSAISGQ